MRTLIQNILLVGCSVYAALFIAGLYFMLTNQVGAFQDRRQAILSGEAQALLLAPSSFLKMLDARGSENLIEHHIAGMEPIAFPLAGTPLARIIYCREDGPALVYDSDRFGLRNDDRLWDSRQQDIAIAGDSYAHGACVNQSLQHWLNHEHRLQSISLGTGGNGPLTSYAISREYLRHYQPKRLYHLIYENDLMTYENPGYKIDFEREIINPALARYLTDRNYHQDYFAADQLAAMRDVMLSVSQKLVGEYRGARLGYSLATLLPVRQFISQRFSQQARQLEAGKPLFLNSEHQAKLQQLYRQFSALNEARISFVILPSKQCLKGEHTAPDAIHRQLALAEIPSQHILDVTQAMCEEALYTKRGSHFNEEGYRKLAGEIAVHYKRTFNAAMIDNGRGTLSSD